MTAKDASEAETVPVWDIGVRAFHWLLVAAVLAAALTGFILGRTVLTFHLAAGVIVLGAVAWRLIWGFLGTAFARFSSFAYGPRAVSAHLESLLRGRSHRHLGHNPLGAMMIFALLAVLPVLGLTGTVALGGMLKQGPLRAFLSYAAGREALTFHYWLAILLLVMIAAHLAGVIFESWRGRENLTGAMLTGVKPARPPPESVIVARAHPVIALAILLGLAAIAGWSVLALAALPGRGVPPATHDPVFTEQCGACHLAYPPSLAPAATWDGILADLQHHFGADASLSPEQVAQIRAWLEANAAEHWDTLPAHLLRRPATDGSHRITDTPGWLRRHRHIPDAVFRSTAVNGRSNCDACHADAASGRFSPQAIAIPKSAVVPSP